jgi:hypothetical protein
MFRVEISIYSSLTMENTRYLCEISVSLDSDYDEDILLGCVIV